MLIIGIDGGGSNTVARVARFQDDRSVQVAEGRGGPSNPQIAGFEIALKNVATAVEAAFRDLGESRRRADSACLALAGCDRPLERRRVQDWAKAFKLAERLTIVNDALPLLAACGEVPYGIAIISGTGSFAYGRDWSGREARCGGWGPLFGDEGSGYALSVAALRAVVQADDGRGPATMASEAILEFWDLSATSQLIDKVYGQQMPRHEIAELAPLVFRCAEDEDQVCTRLLSEMSRDLADMVEALVGRLQLSRDFPLAVGGGCLLSQAALRIALSAELARRHLPAKLTLVPDPVAGALSLAQADLA